MRTERYTYECDLDGCPVTIEGEEWGNVPAGWVEITAERPHPMPGMSNSTSHFCGWRHAAEFCSQHQELEQKAAARPAVRQMPRVRRGQ